MRGLVTKFITSSIALALVAANVSPACLSAEPAFKPETPTADTRQIAPAPRPSMALAAKPQKAFKLNAGITQEYVLGPGDVMSITDLSSDEDKGSTTMAPVLPDGTAVINYAGVIEAAGLSLRELNTLINEKAKKWFVNPEIVVNLARQRATQVYMLGEVTHPGLYSPGSSAGASAGGDAGGEAGGESQAQAPAPSGIFTVSSALEMAGGLKETADIRHLHVTRLHPKQVIDVDLWKLMLDGDVSEDLVLQPGDVIYVPKGGSEFNTNDFGKVVANAHKVRVLGAVTNPGLLVMSGDDDILSVIAKAGGFTDTAKDGFVILARTNRDGSIKTEKIDMKLNHAIKNPESQARVKVRAGDVIVVKDSNTKKALKFAGKTMPQLLMNAAMQTMMYRINAASVASKATTVAK
jgi:polysaccharide export outer membrane protein